MSDLTPGLDQVAADTAAQAAANAAAKVALENEVADLRAQLATANAPSWAAVVALKTKKGLKKFGVSVLAALSTPDAVKAEKSLVVVVLVRVAILVPSAAESIHLLVKILGG